MRPSRRARTTSPGFATTLTRHAPTAVNVATTGGPQANAAHLARGRQRGPWSLPVTLLSAVLLLLLLGLGSGADLAVAQPAATGSRSTVRAADRDAASAFDAAASRAATPRPFDFFGGLTFDPAVPEPAMIVGHRIGERFTRYDAVVDYIEALDRTSPRVVTRRYGLTHQRRPLYTLTITSEANHADLEAILNRNLELIDPRRTDPARAQAVAETNPAIVWLSYNVHGNEASCTEAALQVAYTLAAATNPEVETILDNLVVVIDPCFNPDGRERYLAFFENNMGQAPDPYSLSSEHREPWPGGRSNHYLFDLNRDWVWGIHPESRSRLNLYRRFMPQLHIDNHEQGMHSPYFFGAGDAPYNLNIPQESREWFDLYGRANAEVFDRYGLPYATKERFDYLYPGYGKVLPVYHGAIGLLTEQGGHSRAGLAVTVDDDHGPGLVLTLERRAWNHFLTSMSYLETTARLRREQIERFARYFRESMTVPEGATTAYIFDPSTDPEKLGRLLTLCQMHRIEIDELTEPADSSAVSTYHPPFRTGANITLPAGAWVIRSGQPMGRLARTLLERDTAVEDIDTYDITSWSVPVMIGLRGWEYNGPISALRLRPLDLFAFLRQQDRLPEPNSSRRGENADPRLPQVALLVPAQQFEFPLALAAAARHNLFARLTGDTIAHPETASGPGIAPGSLLVHTVRNDPNSLHAFMAECAEPGLQIVSMDHGYPARGPTLGNNANRRYIVPKIALARGEPISSLSFGHTWHLLDVQSPTPHSTINLEDFASVDWSDFNVLVLPSTSGLGNSVSETTLDRIKEWVRNGGTVVAIGSAARWASSTLIGLKPDENVGRPRKDGETDEAVAVAGHSADVATASPTPVMTHPAAPEGWRGATARDLALDNEALKNFELTWAEREARGPVERVSGAVLSALVDTSHPLAAGADARLGFHVFSATPLPVGDNGHIVARFGPLDDQGGPRIGGYISPRNLAALAGTPAVTHHRVGGGTVICFASDPTNRGMNQAAMRLLLNAILLGPSMSSALQPLGEVSADNTADGDGH